VQYGQMKLTGGACCGHLGIWAHSDEYGAKEGCSINIELSTDSQRRAHGSLGTT